jgi:hypothetical protein
LLGSAWADGVPVDDISKLLNGMGNTSDEVAATVRAARARGLRDSPSLLNPIVRFLNRSLTIGGKLEVGAGGSKLRLQKSGKVQEVDLPAPVQAFLEAFHRGDYPELEGTR